MICWCRFIFLLHTLLLFVFDHWITSFGLSLLNYSCWSFNFTTELLLLVFDHWITPLGLSLLNYSCWSFTIESLLLVFHHWITTVAELPPMDCCTWITPIGCSSLSDLMLQWCVPREKKGLVHRVSSVWRCVWSDRYLTNCHFGALTTYARRARLTDSSKYGLWSIHI